MSPHRDPKLEDSKPIFLHDTLANNVASPYQFWLQKVQQLRRYGPDEHSLEFWTFSVTLTLTTTEQSNFFQKTFHLMMMCHQTKFSCKRISSSDNIFKRQNLIILSVTVILTLKTANQSFWKTIWLIITHHHTSLIVTGSAFQKISSGQTFTDILKFCSDLDLEHNTPTFPQNILVYDNVLPNQVW